MRRHYEKETSCWPHPVGEEEKTIGKGRYHQIWPQDRELKPSKEIVHWARNIKPRIKNKIKQKTFEHMIQSTGPLSHILWPCWEWRAVLWLGLAVWPRADAKYHVWVSSPTETEVLCCVCCSWYHQCLLVSFLPSSCSRSQAGENLCV